MRNERTQRNVKLTSLALLFCVLFHYKRNIWTSSDSVTQINCTKNDIILYDSRLFFVPLFPIFSRNLIENYAYVQRNLTGKWQTQNTKHCYGNAIKRNCKYLLWIRSNSTYRQTKERFIKREYVSVQLHFIQLQTLHLRFCLNFYGFNFECMFFFCCGALTHIGFNHEICSCFLFSFKTR